MLDKTDLEALLESARVHHRHLKRLREDTIRLGVIDNTGGDAIYVKQQQLAKTIEKLQKLLGIIPS